MADHQWSYAADVKQRPMGFPVKANSAIAHGDLVTVDASGWATALDVTGKFVGIALHSVTGNGTNGGKRVRVCTRGTIFTMTAIAYDPEGDPPGTPYTIANVGDLVYSPDAVGSFTNVSTDTVTVGKLAGRDPSGQWQIAFEAAEVRSV